jgi:hypothetical protein
MKTQWCVMAGITAMVCVAGIGSTATLPPDSTGVPAQMVVTVLPGPGGSRPQSLGPGDLAVMENHSPARVVRLERLSGDLANLQLFVLLDDSTRSASLGVHMQELKTFLKSLPATTQVAIGYMRNGSFALAQSFTADHQQAADTLRLPNAIPGENGSPYFAMADLVKHWPSKEAGSRRAVLMLTDGVDRYWGTAVMDDPYLDQAVNSALKSGVMVYSIYLRGSGLYGRGAWVKDFAQSRLIQVSEETGGNAYFEVYSDPIDIAPFLSDLESRLENQYRVTIGASGKGFQPVKVRTELPGLKIGSPTRIYVP